MFSIPLRECPMASTFRYKWTVNAVFALVSDFPREEIINGNRTQQGKFRNLWGTILVITVIGIARMRTRILGDPQYGVFLYPT